ncbi:GtrA family protein [Mesorhizobium australicum]|uniref:Putative flippase GtrA (Transmembrane translocase of bactoprenol-linked glucose) n=1 Tax=Mesorhizobium australicum TaxID=536018 RepID=A0A1X7PFL5_9HYPH|nr:GtrA family protein [Mesorhizobium australicum]SMH49680.1 Putative flippase GtrA (transmembrane translocase of bactoprenol-linked glucose) [Mesorhizobium australicum]
MAGADDLRRYARRLTAFVGIGAFNTIAFFLISTALFQWAGLSATACGYIAYAVLVPVSFFGHRRITFSSNGAIAREWLKFCVIQAVNLAIVGVATAFAESGLIPGWVSFALISVLIPALNFVIFQLWVFSGRAA